MSSTIDRDATAFAHKADNTAASSKESHTLNFQQNALNNYDVVTYHWKFFITSLENAQSGDILTLANQVVIAESGVSDLTIDKVEMNAIAIPSVETGTGTQTTFKFEIVEPSGAGLLDKMFYEAISLGIGNWLVMPCFLQLEFRGRNPEDQSSDLTGAPGNIGNQRWVWPIKLTNAKANVTTVGTRYEFDAITYNELAQSNSYFGLQHNTTLNNLTTFQEAMADLESKINADQIEKLIDNYSIPDTYKIIVDPVFLGKNGIITPPDNNQNTSRGGDYVKFNEKTATYNTGTTIDKIIDSLLGNTAYYQEKMQGSSTPSSKPGTAITQPDQMKKFWRVITETHPIAFDPLRQDNAVEITIFIIEYDIGVLDVNASQTGQTPDAIEAAKKRVIEYSNKRIFNKIYNYMFTGLNDQVISFDLNMNFSYAASLSRFGGIYSSSQTQTGEGVTNQKHAEEEKNISTQLRQTLQFANSASPADSGKVDAKITEMKKKISESNLDPKTRTRYSEILQYAKPADRASYRTSKQNSGGNITSTSLVTPKKGSPVAFISDVELSSENIKNAQATLKTNQKGKLRPIPYREAIQETNLSFGIDQASDSGRNRVSSVFSTALYSSLDASLMHVKLHIKGDPYWLFPQPLANEKARLDYNSFIAESQPAVAIDNIKNAHQKIRTSVNLYGSDNFIIIRFRTPRIYNETTGVVDPFTDAEMFSGVYKVVTIISKFEMGKFSQELTCLLDPVINITDLRGFLKEIETTQGRPNDRTAAAQVDPRLLTNTNPINDVTGLPLARRP